MIIKIFQYSEIENAWAFSSLKISISSIISRKTPIVSPRIWIGVVMALGTGIPILVQKVIVKPNELAKESPFIANNID